MGRLAHYPAIPLTLEQTTMPYNVDLSLDLGHLHTIRHALKEYAAKFANADMPIESEECLTIKAHIETAIQAWIVAE